MGVAGSNGTVFGESRVGEGGAIVITPSAELLEWLEQNFAGEPIAGAPQQISEGQIAGIRCSDPIIFQRLLDLREGDESVEDVLRGLLGLSAV
jgi:hypothetical protein